MDRAYLIRHLGLAETASDEALKERFAAVVEMAKHAGALRAELQMAEANKQIDAKVMAGKMRPSERSFGLKQAARDPEMFKEWLAQHEAQILNLSGHTPGEPTGIARPSAAGVTADEEAVCKAMGIKDVAKYRAFKASRGPVQMAPSDDDDAEEGTDE